MKHLQALAKVHARVVATQRDAALLDRSSKMDPTFTHKKGPRRPAARAASVAPTAPSTASTSNISASTSLDAVWVQRTNRLHEVQLLALKLQAVLKDLDESVAMSQRLGRPEDEARARIARQEEALVRQLIALKAQKLDLAAAQPHNARAFDSIEKD